MKTFTFNILLRLSSFICFYVIAAFFALDEIIKQLDDPNSTVNPIIGALAIFILGSIMYLLWIASGSYN